MELAKLLELTDAAVRIAVEVADGEAGGVTVAQLTKLFIGQLENRMKLLKPMGLI